MKPLEDKELNIQQEKSIEMTKTAEFVKDGNEFCVLGSGKKYKLKQSDYELFKGKFDKDDN